MGMDMDVDMGMSVTMIVMTIITMTIIGLTVGMMDMVGIRLIQATQAISPMLNHTFSPVYRPL
jgi:hypothetical protein